MTKQATAPTAEQLQDVIWTGVHKRAFLGRMIERGVMTGHESETEKQAALQMGLELFQSYRSGAQKTASTEPGPFTFAKQALDKYLGKQASENGGFDPVTIEGAYACANDPEIYNAALLLGQMEASAA